MIEPVSDVRAMPGSRLSAAGLRAPAIRLAVFAVWFVLVVVMASRHAFWRDEIRALSLALAGPGTIDMLRGIQGEGHPAVWYLLLRGAYDIVGSGVVLPVLAVAVAAASAALLVFVSPFALWLVALILIGKPLLFEYSVVARNYGISALVLFVMAAVYPRCRERGIWLGLLAALLANTNAHAVLLAGAFMLFWLADLAWERRLGWNRALFVWALNGMVATVGIVLCVVTVYPPYNDAVEAYREAVDLRSLVTAALIPASSFAELMLYSPAHSLGLDPVSSYPASTSRRLLSLLMFGSTAGLLRRPGAVLAALAALVGLSLFFAVVYPGSYRHDALWLMFLIALYWIVAARTAGPPRGGRIGLMTRRLGFGCFLAILLLQVPAGVESARQALFGPPYSQVKKLAKYIQAHPELRNSILVPDPDFLLEALPYYVDNQIYLPRAEGFARVSRFTKSGTLLLSLGDLVEDVRRLCRRYERPVLLVLSADPERLELPGAIAEGYNMTLTITAAQLEALHASMTSLGRFEPAVSDETFNVYAMQPPCGT